MNFFKFFISKVFFKNLFIAIILIIAIIWGTFRALNIFTQHGEAYSVPDFSGLTIDEVMQLTGEKKLRYQIIDSVYLPYKKRGTIVNQSPPANFKVKENRTIFLTLNAFYAERVNMPNLIGVSLRQANDIIETYGLNAGKLKYVSDLARNNVLEQKYNGKNIQKGTLINKGSYIDLILGKGLRNKKTSVPKLINLTQKEARRKLILASLNTGNIYYDKTVLFKNDSAEAKVWKQYPKYTKNATSNLGSYVNIWLTINEKKIPQTDTTMTNEGMKDL